MSKKTTKAEESEIIDVAEAAVAPLETVPTEGLVKMHKDGEDLHVHPTTVEAHQDAGWKVA